MKKNEFDDDDGGNKKDAAPAPVPEAKFDAEVSAGKFKTWFPELTPAQNAALVTYVAELHKFNKTINLVSSGTLRVAESVHVADSVMAAKLIEPSLLPEPKIYDFGSGNGFPGLVLALLFPKRQIVLLDRDQRKMEFCKHAASTMGLTNVSFQVQNVEDVGDRQVINVVARGFAPFQRCLLSCRKQVKKGGRFFHLKSDGWATELAGLPSQYFTHWTPSLLGQYRIPESNVENYVVMTEKQSE